MSDGIPIGSERSSPDMIPRPDPSTLTTAAIDREMGYVQRELLRVQESFHSELIVRQNIREREAKSLEDLFNTRVDSIQKQFDSKIDSINAATDLRLQNLREIPDNIKEAVDHHEDLQLERFRGVAQQFAERDIRGQQAQVASADALAAALQAAKELVGAQGEASAAAAVKSETSFTKQIDQIAVLINTSGDAVDKRITELKERIDRGEGNQTGVLQNHRDERDDRTDDRGGNNQNMQLIMAFLLIMSLSISIAAIVFK